MSGTSEDVKTLFRRFGGESDTYQEVVREGASVKALGKWAMLGQVDITHPQLVPGVKRAVKTALTRPMTEGMYAEPAPRAAVPIAVLAVAQSALLPVIEHEHAVPLVQPVSMVTPELEREEAPLKQSELRPPAIEQPVRAQIARSLPARAPAAGSSISNSPASTPLVARLKAQSVSIQPPIDAIPAENHTLSGLFGRLSKSLSPNTKQGVLRRKFSK